MTGTWTLVGTCKFLNLPKICIRLEERTLQKLAIPGSNPIHGHFLQKMKGLCLLVGGSMDPGFGQLHFSHLNFFTEETQPISATAPPSTRLFLKLKITEGIVNVNFTEFKVCPKPDKSCFNSNPDLSSTLIATLG